MRDVAQEGRIWTDDEHSSRRQLIAVGVEQVRRAVQCDSGLACSRTALHDERAVEVGADDAVLLGLDRLDDVAHTAGATSRQRGEQGRLAGEILVRRAPGSGQVQHLIVDADHGAVLGADVAATPNVQRSDRGGEVERARCRRSPVDEQRLLVGVLGEQSDSADVATRPVLEVEPAEAQTLLDRVELREPVGVEREGRVPLGAGLRCSAGGGEHLGEAARGVTAQLVEASVQR